ncbi:uncharacterized protein LOC123566391 isoform X1 [Mercenaria mercenaria]|uniref:uncharacterized protein LOC123566391 isoform X1 n=1 Tax=Mercenaria mercenaria TaxID=6596 RepID=UPI00234F1FA3|nr:uncharacterized protein LOC123566391 isoform X1 [Mercenaria mercenaria]
MDQLKGKKLVPSPPTTTTNMAASMLKSLGSNKILRLCRISDFYRTFLSDSYKCDQLWKERLKSQYLQKIDPKTFGIQLLDSFEETKTLHAVDIDLFVNKIQDLPSSFTYLVNDVLHRFRHCSTSVPIQDSIMHAIVRGHLMNGQLDNLLELIKDKSKYGVFPDDHSMCMLLDHYIKNEDYKAAAQLAYDVMLQEEYENQMKNLLALYAAVKHFSGTMDLERPEPEPANEDEEVEYIAVKVIRNPYYDDHFDIKDERFLLGKTLYNISKNTATLDGAFSRSLQLIGLGLYEKFELANQLLEEWIADETIKDVVYSKALEQYSEFLNSAPTRDPDAEAISMGDKTIDDEIELLKLTPEAKTFCLTKLQTLTLSLSKDRSPDENIEEKVETFLTSGTFSKYEKEDIKILTENYKQWMLDRDKNVVEYLKEKKRQEIEEGIHAKLAALQEREELLTYFANIDEIQLSLRHHKEEVIVVKEKEEYVEAPGERNVKLAIKRKR